MVMVVSYRLSIVTAAVSLIGRNLPSNLSGAQINRGVGQFWTKFEKG